MFVEPLLLEAFTRSERNAVIDAAQAAIASVGWLTDFRLFSNTAVSLMFEIEAGNIGKLRAALEGIPVRFDDEGWDGLNRRVKEVEHMTLPEGTQKFIGTLFITFLHDERDLRRPVPKVPG